MMDFIRRSNVLKAGLKSANVFPEDLSAVGHLLVLQVLAGHSGEQKLCL